MQTKLFFEEGELRVILKALRLLEATGDISVSVRPEDDRTEDDDFCAAVKTVSAALGEAE